MRCRGQLASFFTSVLYRFPIRGLILGLKVLLALSGNTKLAGINKAALGPLYYLPPERLVAQGVVCAYLTTAFNSPLA